MYRKSNFSVLVGIIKSLNADGDVKEFAVVIVAKDVVDNEDDDIVHDAVVVENCDGNA